MPKATAATVNVSVEIPPLLGHRTRTDVFPEEPAGVNAAPADGRSFSGSSHRIVLPLSVER
jgi:hypothetical protein